MEQFLMYLRELELLVIFRKYTCMKSGETYIYKEKMERIKYKIMEWQQNSHYEARRAHYGNL